MGPRLGQNFLSDPNLLDAIVRDAELGEGEVVLEVGAGEGVLTERLADVAAHLHTLELDRRLEPALAQFAARANVSLRWGDAMKLDFASLEPAPTAVVSNLPYSVATPVILRTIEELPTVGRWTVMVQREIADRLRAAPGSRTYGSPSVIAQLACEVRLIRKVDPAVFRPRPRVDSAILGLRRTGPGADPPTRELVRAAFAHRRKSLARSLEHLRPGSLAPARAALEELGLVADARAESLSPDDFAALSAKLRESRSQGNRWRT
jgi:16S rRNA (adenine1518-N6/adenine1519-N6)-dimethyltransferase